jgi:hypothetical protein
MSALQITATQRNATQRVCRGLVSLPETQLGTVSVSADGNSVFFWGISGCSQNGDHQYQVAVVCFNFLLSFTPFGFSQKNRHVSKFLK